MTYDLMINRRSFFFFFFVFIFTLFFSSSLSDPRISEAALYCGPGSNGTSSSSTGGNTTEFAANYDQLMRTQVSAIVSAQHFAAMTFGNSPLMYVVADCMNDLSMPECMQCFAESIVKLQGCLPSSSSSARVYLDGCFLRYDNYNFFEETVDPKFDKVICDDSGSVSTSENINIDFSKKAGEAIDRATTTASYSNVKVAEVKGGKVSAYAYAECWTTVRVSGCKECLENAARGVKGCLPNKQGRGLNPGCYVRYSTEKFYNTHDSRKKWLIWVLVIVPIALLILISRAFIWLWCLRRRMRKLKETGNTDQSEDLLLFDLGFSIKANNNENNDVNKAEKVGKDDVDNMPLFSFSSVSAATDNFSAANKLGEGGFGPVYKGKLLKGQEVAAKRLSKRSGQGLEELRNEVVLIAKLQHKYLVRLLGCCIEGEEKILIYEYMPNKSLDTFLFDSTKGRELDWERRKHIVDGIAQGLLYLHQYSRFRIIHRDLKASNILLDGEMNPKISDFGLARIFGGNQSEANTARIVGTYGYMSPEYAMEGHFSIKSDVFSFGVLLLEIVSGKKNTGFYLSDCLNLLGYAWDLWKNDRLVELMDSRLGDASSSFTSVLLRYIHVAFLCVQESAADRPTMSDVCSMLKDEFSTLPSFKQPAFCTGRSVMDENLHARKTRIHTLNDLTISNIEGR